MVEIPVKALVQITKLRHYLMILSSFILFFSIIPVWYTGLNRHDELIGSIFFFISAIAFWFSGETLDLHFKLLKEKDYSGSGL